MTATQRYRTIDDLPEFCTLADLSEVLGISRASAYRLAGRRQIPCIRLGRRIVLSRGRLKQWIDQEMEGN